MIPRKQDQAKYPKYSLTPK